MAQEEIIAVFKADIEQFKTQMSELGIKVGAVQAKVDATGASTEKFAGHSKSAAASVSTLSRGLGGITGLLGITGRLFGVNTDKLEGFIFASREFIKVARDVSHAQHLSNLATERGRAVKVADEGATVSLTIAQRVLNAVMSGGVGIVLAIGAALVAGIGIITGYNKANETRKQIQEDLNKLEKESTKIFLDSQKQRRDALKTSFENDLQQKVNNREITETQKERQLLDRQFAIDSKLNSLTQEQQLKDLEKRRVRDNLSSDTVFKEKLLIQGQFIDKSLALTETFNAADNALKIKEAKEEKDGFLETRQEILSANVDFNEENKKQRKEQADKIKADKKKLDEEMLLLNEKYNREVSKQREDADQLKIKTEAEAGQAVIDATEKNRLEVLAAIEAQNERIAKKAEDKRLERLALEKQALDSLFTAQQEAFDKRKELEDKQISLQEKNIDVQRDLAARGLDNTLAFEQKRATELARQQQVEAQKQKRIKLLETFLNSLADFSKTDPKTALQKALLQVALATAASAVFAEEGGIIGEIGHTSNLRRRHKGGGDVLLHAQTGEGILSRREMDNLGKRNFHLLKDAARFPIRDDVFGMPKIALAGGMAISNTEVVKELKALRLDIKNQKRESWEVNKFGEYIKTSIENGVTEVTKGKMPKLRFK